MIKENKIDIQYNNIYDLENLGQAHDEIENRRTTGSVILKV
jgi:hypothetical protein